MADPLRLPPGRRRRRVPRRPVRRRHDDDQHEGGAAGARERHRKVASGDRADERRLGAVLARRAGAVLRAGRAAARRARAQRLAALRAHDRGGFPRARVRARARHFVHGRQLHALRLVSPGLPHERRQVDRKHLHRRRVGARAARTPAGLAGRPCGRRGRPRDRSRGRRGDRPRRHGRGRRRGAEHPADPQAVGPGRAGDREVPRVSIPSASSTACSTSRRTRTSPTRSPRTSWGTSTTRTAAS